MWHHFTTVLPRMTSFWIWPNSISNAHFSPIIALLNDPQQYMRVLCWNPKTKLQQIQEMIQNVWRYIPSVFKFSPCKHNNWPVVVVTECLYFSFCHLAWLSLLITKWTRLHRIPIVCLLTVSHSIQREGVRIAYKWATYRWGCLSVAWQCG